MLKLERLSFDVKEEKGTKKILSNINLTVDDGKFVVVTGPNGGGKSTLAKLIAGIESPASGSIFMEGHDITDMSISERAKNGISFAFQQPVVQRDSSVGFAPNGFWQKLVIWRCLRIFI